MNRKKSQNEGESELLACEPKRGREKSRFERLEPAGGRVKADETLAKGSQEIKKRERVYRKRSSIARGWLKCLKITPVRRPTTTRKDNWGNSYAKAWKDGGAVSHGLRNSWD